MKNVILCACVVFMAGVVSADLVIITNSVANTQAEARIPMDGLGGYNPAGVRTTSIANLKAGEYAGTSGLARGIAKFAYDSETVLGGEMLESAVLRLYIRSVGGLNGAGGDVDLLASQTESANTAVAVGNFDNSSFTWVGTKSFTNALNGTWVEYDVTAAVLADLAGDGALNQINRGSAFRLQFVGDLALSTTDGYLSYVDFGDNSDAGQWPELVLTIIPEPATMALLGLGVLVLRKKISRKLS